MKFLLDEVMELARYLRVNWRKDDQFIPPWIGYRCSMPAYILGEIEKNLDIETEGNLYDRLERCKEVGFAKVDSELATRLYEETEDERLRTVM